MTDSISKETYLPLFPGFYNTEFEFEGNDWEYAVFNNPDKIDSKVIEFLSNELVDIMDNEGFENATAERCVEYVNSSMPFGLTYMFERVWSPKEYNFKNDVINVLIDINPEQWNTIKYVISETKDKFARLLKDKFTSYSGFMSFYSNDFGVWWEKITAEDALESLNSVEIGVILEHILLTGRDEDELYEGMVTNVLECRLDFEFYNTDIALKLLNAEYGVDLNGLEDYEGFDPDNVPESLEYRERKLFRELVKQQSDPLF